MTMQSHYEQAIVRLAATCDVCGGPAHIDTACGHSGIYKTKTARARAAVEADPEKSNRAIAADIGVSPDTVDRARKQLPDDQATERIGQDGKTYPATRPESVVRPPENPKIGPANIRNVFLMNCAASTQAARYEGPLDDEIRAAARRAADVWSNLAEEMEKGK